MSLNNVDPDELELVGPYAEEAVHLWIQVTTQLKYHREGDEFFIVFLHKQRNVFRMYAHTVKELRDEEYRQEIKELMALLMEGFTPVGAVSQEWREKPPFDVMVAALPAGRDLVTEDTIFEVYDGIFRSVSAELEGEN